MIPRGRRSRRTKSPRLSLPKAFAPGVPIAIVPGRALRVALLGATDEELFGVELASGAYVRVERSETAAPQRRLDAAQPHQRRPPRYFTPSVVSCVPRADDPMDPGRPEAMWLAEPPADIGPIRPRQLRRLANAVVAFERRGGLILNSRGPSIAYGDLNPQGDSMMLIGVELKRLELRASNADAVTLAIGWGGVTQRIPVLDLRACAAARAHPDEPLHGDALVRALGYKPGFALVAFDRVRDGYVRKIVIALLAR